MKIVSLPRLSYYCFKERKAYDISSLLEYLNEGGSIQIESNKVDSYSLGTYIFPKWNALITKGEKVSKCHYLWTIQWIDKLNPSIMIINTNLIKSRGLIK